MRILLVGQTGLLAEEARQRLEGTSFSNIDVAKKNLQASFPNHLVLEAQGRLRVSVRDKSFTIAEFRQV
jgi:hypothetical protein